MADTIPDEPLGRKETYLAKIAGQNVEVPEPLGREEQYLNYIAKHGGGGGGTNDYNQLDNKPQVNDVELIGNKTGKQLNLASLDGNTFTALQHVQGGYYSGVKIEDASDANIYTNFGKTGFITTDGTDSKTVAYTDLVVNADLKYKADINDTTLTGTTKAENITVSGDLTADSVDVETSITVPTPSDDTDAANKGYVDTQDAALDTRIDNLENIGRFLALWNCATGLPVTNPTTMPYTYKTGDYYRVTTVSDTTNYKPNGASYDGTASTTTETETVAVGAIYYYDGTNWNMQAAGSGGGVQFTSQTGAPSSSTGNTGDLDESTADYRNAVYIKNSQGWRQMVTNENADLNQGLRIMDKASGNTIFAIYGNSNTYQGGISIGQGSGVKAKGQMDIGTSYTNFGYNNSNYRLLTGLYDPQSDHDAANKEYVVSYSAINGEGEPTTSTEAKYVGQLYYDTTNSKMYYCSAIDTTTPAYTWAELGGGSSVNVVQETGTSTTDVMSQNATTSMVFADPDNKHKIQIGKNAQASSDLSIAIGSEMNWGTKASASDSIAIGSDARTDSAGAVCLGYNTIANNPYGVALGAYSSTSNKGEFSIGGLNLGTNGYNSTQYRLLTNVYDGQNAHDAATLAQGNTLATSAPTTSTVGVLGQLYTDTSEMHTYQCTAIDGDTYTWTQRW